MASPKISLKLLVDKKGPRVLFAEAPKEFVDFLFHILSLPLGTLIEFLGSNQMVGCLGKLKDSIQTTFHENYLQPGIKLEHVFYPKTPFSGDTLFLLSYDTSSKDQSKRVYHCANAATKTTTNAFGNTSLSNSKHCQSKATLHANSICPSCNGSMNVEMELVTPKEVAETKGGYVKEVVTYMVMDDLVVKPMSTISSITLKSHQQSWCQRSESTRREDCFFSKRRGDEAIDGFFEDG
ncbi:hypothetical protein QVD17_31380 [Tagetes erecta]|uniref:DUF674 domain-containing protein n=1 Tax=Tagetes erecta TaxID=13708 RepID=A0AAD8K3M9_TARER|nr:hypothetical protein QVD17_31380 [Tagetes erecta]